MFDRKSISRNAMHPSPKRLFKYKFLIDWILVHLLIDLFTFGLICLPFDFFVHLVYLFTDWFLVYVTCGECVLQFNTDMCKFESSHKDKSRTHPADSSKTCSKPKVSILDLLQCMYRKPNIEIGWKSVLKLRQVTISKTHYGNKTQVHQWCDSTFWWMLSKFLRFFL